MTSSTLLSTAWLALALLGRHAAEAAPIVLASAPDPLAPPPAFALVAGGRAYIASHDPADWSGRLRAWRIDPATGQPGATPEWDSAAHLDAPGYSTDRRMVIGHDGVAGAAFRWNSLAPAQRSALNGAETDASGRQRLDFVRGDHAAETARGGSLRDRLRQVDGRAFRQGDTVHSRPWLTGRPINRALPPALGDRPDMVYIGGNDGMLHGFDAATGVERLAYVPRGIFGQLRAWTAAGGLHRYLVDGSAFTGEADIRTSATSSAWATVLIGTAGAGAPGFFILDVSRPAGFTEAAAAAIVLADTTDGADADIGHITADPATDASGTRSTQIVQMNDGRWAVLMGNGVNSRNEMPVLLLQYLDKSRELRRLAPPCPPDTCAHRGSNGLSTPLVVDTDGDGKADVAYAGDLLGHVWKFDLRSDKPADWKVALEGRPLFVARDALGNRQPISAAPTWLPHPLGGIMLGLGTGRELTVEDRGDTHVQTIYGLYDRGSPIDTASLVAQTPLPGTRSIGGHEYSRSSANGVDYQSERASGGWYLNLPARGEKVLHAPRPFAGQKAMFSSSAAGREYLTVLNLFSGQPSVRPAFAALVDPAYAVAGPPFDNASRVSLSRSGASWLVDRPGQWLLASPGEAPLVLSKGHGAGIRAGWRQLQ